MMDFIRQCWDQDKNRRVLWLPVLFGLGIALYFSFSQEPSRWLTISVVEGLIVLSIIFRHYPKTLKFLGVLACVVAGFAFIQGKSIWLSSFNDKLPKETFYFKGKVEAIDTNYQGRPRFVLSNLEDFDGQVYKGLYRVTQRSKSEMAAVGSCVEMVGTISPLSKEVVVGGYQFDRKAYFEGLKGSGFAESRWFEVECEHKSIFSFREALARLRQRIVQKITDVLPTSESGIAAAVIAGEKGAVSEELYTQYRNAGLAHFLAISGLHMSMLASLMFFLVRLLLVFFPRIALQRDTKKIAAVFALLAAFGYLLISGMGVPAIRAFIMIFVVLLGVLFNRRAISMYSVALAAFFVLLISPEVIVSASFQMSFAAVVGLIAFYERVAGGLQKFFSRGNRFLRGVVLYFVGVVVSDFIASVMTLPFAVYHFNMIAVYTTLGNLLAGPVIGFVVMPAVLISLLLMPFGVVTVPLKVVGLGIELLNHITAFVSAMPEAAYYVPSMPHWGLMLIVIGGLWLCLWQAKWKYFGIIFIVFGVLSLFAVKTPDIVIGPEAKAVAIKNSDGELEISSGRSGKFIKDVLKNKYKVSPQKVNLKDYKDLQIKGEKVFFRGKMYDLEQEIGMSIWIKDSATPKIKSIREDIGHRLWNE